MSCKIVSMGEIPWDAQEIINDSDVFVTDYETDCYEGKGFALVQRKNGNIELYNLSHCSCNDPMEQPFLTWNSIDEFLNDESVLHQDYPSTLKDIFVKLVRS